MPKASSGRQGVNKDGLGPELSPAGTASNSPTGRRVGKSSSHPVTEGTSSQAVPSRRSNSPAIDSARRATGAGRREGRNSRERGQQRRRRSLHVMNRQQEEVTNSAGCRSTTPGNPRRATASGVLGRPSPGPIGPRPNFDPLTKAPERGSKGFGGGRRGGDDVARKSDDHRDRQGVKPPEEPGGREYKPEGAPRMSAQPSPYVDAHGNGFSHLEASLPSGSPPITESYGMSGQPPVKRYTIDQLRKLRYLPSANQKPPNLHILIDRTKPSPALSLCQRGTPRPNGPSRTRRPLEPWPAGPTADVRAGSVGSLGEAQQAHEELESQAPGPPDTSTTETARVGSASGSAPEESSGSPLVNSGQPPDGTPAAAARVPSSTMGSADVAPFVPRQRQLGPTFTVAAEPHVTMEGSMDGAFNMGSVWDPAYNTQAAYLDQNSRVPALELQRDPAISSYQFNPAHQPSAASIGKLNMSPYMSHLGASTRHQYDHMWGAMGEGTDMGYPSNDYVRGMQYHNHHPYDDAPDEDLWDAPSLGDTAKIFTLGDIRGARPCPPGGLRESTMEASKPAALNPLEAPPKGFANGVRSNFFEEEEDESSAMGSTFLKSIFRKTGNEPTPARDTDSRDFIPGAPPLSVPAAAAGPQSALETLLHQQLGGLGNVSTQELRSKLDMWARTKGHTNFSELVASQQKRLQQQRAQQQQYAGHVPPLMSGQQPPRAPMPHPGMDMPPAEGQPSYNSMQPQLPAAVLQALQKRSLSSEQAAGLARLLQEQPQLVGALLENLKQRRQAQQSRPVPPMPPHQSSQQPRPAGLAPNHHSLPGVQQQLTHEQQQQVLLNLVRQKLLAPQQVGPVVGRDHTIPGHPQQMSQGLGRPVANPQVQPLQQQQPFPQQQQQHPFQQQQPNQQQKYVETLLSALQRHMKDSSINQGQGVPVQPQFEQSRMARMQEIQRLLQLSTQQGTSPQVQDAAIREQLQQLLRDQQQASSLHEQVAQGPSMQSQRPGAAQGNRPPSGLRLDGTNSLAAQFGSLPLAQQQQLAAQVFSLQRQQQQQQQEYQHQQQQEMQFRQQLHQRLVQQQQQQRLHPGQQQLASQFQQLNPQQRQRLQQLQQQQYQQQLQQQYQQQLQQQQHHQQQQQQHGLAASPLTFGAHHVQRPPQLQGQPSVALQHARSAGASSNDGPRSPAPQAQVGLRDVPNDENMAPGESPASENQADGTTPVGGRGEEKSELSPG